MLTFHANGTIEGINNSNFLNSIPSLERRVTSSVVSLAGVGDHTFTLTPGVKKFEVLITDASSNNNSNMLLYLGDAGGVESSGYGYASGFHRANGTGGGTNWTSSFETYGLDSTSYQIYGTWKIWNPTGNTWLAQHSFWGSAASNHEFWGLGYKTLSDTITKFNIACKNGQFDSGTMTVVEFFSSS
tara:strand:+ start:61 stop:618 length:558 start_codon:yes stop_codon:yes gene_type:complete